MQLLKTSWRRSLFAGLVGAFIVPHATTAQEVEVEVNVHENDGEPKKIQRKIHVERRYLPGQQARKTGERRIIRESEIPEAAVRVRHRALTEQQAKLKQELELINDQLQASNGPERRQLQFRVHQLEEAFAESREAMQQLAQRKQQGQQQRIAVREGSIRESSNSRERHIHAAIENLRAAGMHEHAKRIAEQLQEEKEHRRATTNRVASQRENFSFGIANRQKAEPVSVDGSIRREMNEMRQQMRKMQQVMQELLRRSERSEERNERTAFESFGEHQVHEEHDESKIHADEEEDDAFGDGNHSHDHDEDEDEDEDPFG